MTAAPSADVQWISAFLEAQAAELDAARNTRLAYGRDLKDFMGWLAHRKQGFAKAGRDDIEAYLLSCDANGLSKSTRARRLSAIRQLFRFAHDEGWRDENPAIRIKGPGSTQRLPTTLDHAEVDRLLDAARSKGRNATERLRNRALLELLYATVMRVSELLELPIAAVRGDPRMILVRGKGGKERMVPLSTPARAALADWLAWSSAMLLYSATSRSDCVTMPTTLRRASITGTWGRARCDIWRISSDSGVCGVAVKTSGLMIWPTTSGVWPWEPAASEWFRSNRQRC